MNTKLFQAMLALVCLATQGMGLEIVFEGNPTTIQPLLTSNLTLRCSLNDLLTSSTVPPLTSSDITHIFSIAITKDGVDVATVSQQFPAKAFGNYSDVEITGQLSGNSGFLQLVYKYPSGHKAGSYVCDVAGFDQRGHAHVMTKALGVLENEINIADLIGEIHQLKTKEDQMNNIMDLLLTRLNETNQVNAEQSKVIAEQSKSIAEQSKSIAEQSKVINDLLNASHSQEITNKDQEMTNDELRDTINWQNNSIMALNTHVYFSVGLYRSSNTISNNSPVIFDVVITNLGGNYNPATGEFTCTEAGYYQFQLHVLSQLDKFINVLLYHNSNYVTQVLADDNLDFQSASNSVVLLLDKHDIVSVKSYGTSYLAASSSRPFCTFSGVLLSLS